MSTTTTPAPPPPQSSLAARSPPTATLAASALAAGDDDGAFTSIPVLALAQARTAESKPAFLTALRHALLHVGFLYLRTDEAGVPGRLVERVCEETRRFFDEAVLPRAEKERIEMRNERSFLGWSRVGA